MEQIKTAIICLDCGNKSYQLDDVWYRYCKGCNESKDEDRVTVITEKSVIIEKKGGD